MSRPPNLRAWPRRPRRPGRRRGSSFLFIVGIATLMTVIGLSIAVTGRLQTRTQTLSRDWDEAGLAAASAVELALAYVATTPTWRTAHTSGVWTAATSFGRASIQYRFIDENDGNLGNNNAHSARLYGKAVIGSTCRIYSVLLVLGTDGLAHVSPASWRWEVN